MLIDRGSYENPKAYLERNKYFFTRNAAQAVSLKDELYDGGISPTEVWKAVADACSHGAVQTAIGTSEKPDEADLSALWKHIANGAACCNEALVNICRRKAEGVIGKSFERTEAANLELKKSP